MDDSNPLDELIQSIDFETDQQLALQRWNQFLNMLLAGEKLYTFPSNIPGNVGYFQLDPNNPQLSMFAFTSLDEARLAGAPADRLVHLGIRAFIALAVDNPAVFGVTINNATKALVIHRRDLLSMNDYLEGIKVRDMQAGDQIVLGEPKVFPHGLAQALSAEASKHRSISRMWLRQMYAHNELSYLLVIEAPAPDENVMKALSAVAQSHPELTQPLDISMSPTPDGYLDGSPGPIYTRKRRLFER